MSKEKVDYFKSRQIRTVGELRQALNYFTDETKLQVFGADIGGYDVSYHNVLSIDVDEYIDGTPMISFTHDEAEMWQAKNDGELTNEEYDSIELS
jgi:hypothetical protein